MTQTQSNLVEGDEVRYTGDTPELIGMEGLLTHKGTHVASVRVSKGTSHYKVNDVAYPDVSNLERLKPEVAEFVNQLDEAKEAVEHPAHYGGGDNPYEVIKVAEAWGLDEDAYLFNVLKYIARAGKKSKDTELQDNEKAYFYLGRKIKRLKEVLSA